MGWSDKYKKSIDCNNPKGFSQKAHCAGRKIRKENMKLSELKEAIRQVIEARGPSRGFNKLATAYQKEALKHQNMVKDQKRLAAAFVAEKDPKKKEKAKKAIIDHHHKVKDQEKKMKRAEQEMLNGLDKEIVFALFAKFSISLVASSFSLSSFDFVVPCLFAIGSPPDTTFPAGTPPCCFCAFLRFNLPSFAIACLSKKLNFGFFCSFMKNII